MLGAEVLNKTLSFDARRVTKAENRGKPAVKDHRALKNSGDRRQVFSTRYISRDDVAAARYSNVVTCHGSSEPLTGRFADARGLTQLEPVFFGTGKNSTGQWMLRVELQACGKSQDLLLFDTWSD